MTSPTPSAILYNGNATIPLICVHMILNSSYTSIICDHPDPDRYASYGGLGGPNIPSRHAFEMLVAHRDATKVDIAAAASNYVCYVIASSNGTKCECVDYSRNLRFLESRCDGIASYDAKVVVSPNSTDVCFAVLSIGAGGPLSHGLFHLNCIDYATQLAGADYIHNLTGLNDQSAFPHRLDLAITTNPSPKVCYAFSTSIGSRFNCLDLRPPYNSFGSANGTVDSPVKVAATEAAPYVAFFEKYSPAFGILAIIVSIETRDSSPILIIVQSNVSFMSAIFNPDGTSVCYATGSSLGGRWVGCLLVPSGSHSSFAFNDSLPATSADLVFSSDSSNLVAAFGSSDLVEMRMASTSNDTTLIYYKSNSNNSFGDLVLKTNPGMDTIGIALPDNANSFIFYGPLPATTVQMLGVRMDDSASKVGVEMFDDSQRMVQILAHYLIIFSSFAYIILCFGRCALFDWEHSHSVGIATAQFRAQGRITIPSLTAAIPFDLLTLSGSNYTFLPLQFTPRRPTRPPC